MDAHNKGYIEDKIKDEDFIFGGTDVPEDILEPDGSWVKYLPAYEAQMKNGLETMNCTSFGTLHCIEALMDRKYGLMTHFSPRYTGIMAGTNNNGNSPQTMIEEIRKDCGVIAEALLPFSDDIASWNQYYSPNPMKPDLLATGKNWLVHFTIRHEWVFTSETPNKQDMLKEALKHSPLGVAVNLYQQDQNGRYVKPQGIQDNHWVMLYGFDDGKCWRIFDHYEPHLKELSWDFDFTRAKRYFLLKNQVIAPIKERQLSLMQRLLSLMLVYIKEIYKTWQPQMS